MTTRKSSLRLARTGGRSLPGGFAACCLALWLSACGGSGGETAADRDYRTESLVVGDWLMETGLLVLQRSGGRPELRAAADPSLVVWRREARLPAVEAAHGIGERSLVFRAPADANFRWDLEKERAAALGSVEPNSEWSAFSGTVTFWNEDRIVLSDGGGTRTYTAPAPVLWAGPAPDRGVVVLAGGESGPHFYALNEASEVVAEKPLAVRAPGHYTAWGRSVLFRSADARELVLVGIPELEEEARYEFPRPVSAIAISGSSHEIYAAHSGGRIEAVNRISGNRRELARLGAEVTEIRPGIYGQQLLAASPEAVHRVSLDGAPPVRLPVDWRADLPLGLPSGDVLAARGDSVYVARVAAATLLEPVDGRADAWWVPVSWNPSSPRLASARGRDRDSASTAAEASALSAAESDDEAAPEGSVAQGVSEDTLADAGIEAPVGAERTDSLGISLTAPAAGYYAVAVASRSASGVIELVGALARSGYPTAVQRRRDDGGQLWYRALVGPYPIRERAEASARQLRRERELDAWVIEVTAGTEGELQPDSR